MKNTEGGKVMWLKIKRMRYLKGEMKKMYNYDISDHFYVIDLTPKDTNIVEAPTDSPKHNYGTRKRRGKAAETVIQASIIQAEQSKELLPGQLKRLYQVPLPISVAKKTI